MGLRVESKGLRVEGLGLRVESLGLLWVFGVIEYTLNSHNTAL